MRLHQHVLVIFVLIIFVASASLVCPVSSGIAQKLPTVKLNKFPAPMLTKHSVAFPPLRKVFQ